MSRDSRAGRVALGGFEEASDLGKIYDARLLLRLWRFLRPYRALFYASLALIPVRAVLEAAPARIFGAGLDHLTGGPRTPAGWLGRIVVPPEGMPVLPWLAGVLLAVTLLGAAVELLRMLAMAAMGQRAMRDLRAALFAHVQRLPLAFFDRYPVGRLVTRVTNDVENLSEIFASGLVALLADLFLMAYFAAVLLRLEPRLALAAMAVLPALAVAAPVFRWKVREAYRDARVRIARINAYLQETISGMKVVHLFSREERNLEEFARINRAHRDAWFRSIRYDALLFSSVDLASNLTLAAILWYGAGLVGAGEVGLGLLFVFVDYMRRFYRPLMDLSARYSVMQSSMASFERIVQLLDEPPARDPRAGEPLPEVRGEIVFEDVTFGYGAEPVVHGLRFRVRPGERVAFVGPTGSGKTTVLKLLARLYEPWSGRILLDGRPLDAIREADLRRALAFVLQDVFLFTGSVAYNVHLERPWVSDADLEAAIRAARADRIVARLPRGLEQPLQERGTNLSAGERQLLSFARALAGRPRVLLLDEATASVDSETEHLVEEALAELLRGRTALAVAHRLSTVQSADRIFVLHRGRIVEEGSHEELLARRGLYWRLHRLALPEAA